MSQDEQKKYPQNMFRPPKKSRDGNNVCADAFLADVDAELTRAVQLHHQGQTAEAEKIYNSILRTDPNHADCLYLLGVIARGRKEYEEAVRWIEKAIQISPRNPVFFNELGCGYQDQGKFDEAISCYREALQWAPKDADVHYNMGNALKADGRPEEAIPYYLKALDIEPNDPGVHNNLGVAFKDKGDLDEAISCFRNALRLKPAYAAATINMGMALHEKGDAEEAVAAFRHGISLDPENVSARYLLAALTGETMETAPREYVEALFDAYAKRFDRHLEQELAYETPRLLRKALDGLFTGPARFQNALDLGCGTGLSGAAFRSIAARLCGVDVSSAMVEQAREKGIYDRLHVKDLGSYLNGADEKFDLFIATDVFPYIGALAPVFDAIQKCRLGPAYFVFSTEDHAGGNYVLQPTGRYAHAASYIRSLAQQHGFAVKADQPAVIRKGRGEGIPGKHFILQHFG